MTSHFLIIPKRHVERLEMLSRLEWSHIFKIIGKVNKPLWMYFIHHKNGYEVGQGVPHIHIHFIAKQSGDNSSLKFFIKLIIASISKPISSTKMQKVIEKMKIAIESQDSSFQLKE